MNYESIGGSHTNTFLRQVNAGVKSVVEAFADEDGRLNAEVLAIDRPQFKEALAKGLIWFVLHWACAFAWPDLLPFVQGVLNTDARNGQGEVEMMLYIHYQIEAARNKGEEPNIPSIVEGAKS